MSDLEWIAGQVGIASVAVANSAGAAVDPSALRLKVGAPGVAAVTYTYGVGSEIVRDSLGNFHAALTFSVAGDWHWRWESDSPGGVAEESITVARSAVV